MADLTPGSDFAGYRIEGIAGRGGMGIVYRAQQMRPHRTVALKVISPEVAQDAEFRRRFEHESDIAASIEHPNVIPVYEVNEVGGTLFIAMRLVEGTDLREMIATQGRLEPRLAAQLTAQVASALDSAHERGLVHRDVKPANVLIAGRPGAHHAYLTDFGLSKLTTAESEMTKTGMFVGTLDYIAPEQLEGGVVDARTDVYALGCMLYQALAGRVPYPMETDMAKMYAHATADPPSLLEAVPDLPRQFEDVVKRAMAKRPDDRYLSAGDLGRAAQAAADQQSLTRAERSVATGSAAPAAATAVAAYAAATQLGTQDAPGPEPSPTDAGRGPGAAPPFAATTTAGATGAPASDPSSTRKLSRFSLFAGIALVVLAGLAITVALLADRGSGNGDGGAAKPRLSKQEYEDRASDISREVSLGVGNLSAPSVLPGIIDEREQAAEDVGTVQDSLEEGRVALADLEPPKDVEDLHEGTIGALEQLSRTLGDAQAAADSGDGEAYEEAVDAVGAPIDDLSEITADFKQRGYARLGATPGEETGGPALTGEEREVATVLAQARSSFRDRNADLYCLARSPKYLDREYKGSFGYQSCVDAGNGRLRAEDRDLLEGPDLTIEKLEITGGGKGNVANVTATGEGDERVAARVTRDPPSDDVWRVDAINRG